MDDIETFISAQEILLKKNVTADIMKVLFGFFVSIPVITLVSILISRRVNGELNVFFSFLKQADEVGAEIDLEELQLKEFQDLGKATNRMITKRREAEEKLEQLSRTDPLTGLSNRRDMIEKINLEIKRVCRSNEVFSFILIDIDYFKQVNDTYGHDAGDAILWGVSNLLRNEARETDTISRWGGEEFLILLPNSDTDGAIATAEKFRECVQNKEFLYDEQRIKITLTLGVSTWQNGLTYEQLLIMADSALYQGKKFGRNRVVKFAEGEKMCLV